MPVCTILDWRLFNQWRWLPTQHLRHNRPSNGRKRQRDQPTIKHGEPIMSAEDDLIGGLESLLDRFPANADLAAWQHAFRRIVYTAGMRVLKNHPELIVGPAPSHQALGLQPPMPAPMPMMHTIHAGGPPPAVVGGPVHAMPAGGGMQPPYRPNFGMFGCIVSGTCQTPPPQT
jgi:hypothetical protein